MYISLMMGLVLSRWIAGWLSIAWFHGDELDGQYIIMFKRGGKE